MARQIDGLGQREEIFGELLVHGQHGIVRDGLHLRKSGACGRWREGDVIVVVVVALLDDLSLRFG